MGSNCSLIVCVKDRDKNSTHLEINIPVYKNSYKNKRPDPITIYPYIGKKYDSP